MGLFSLYILLGISYKLTQTQMIAVKHTHSSFLNITKEQCQILVSLSSTKCHGSFRIPPQIKQQEVAKRVVAMEMSDLVVYCQPRSKEKDRFGSTHTHTHVNAVTSMQRVFRWV